jgi:glycosyltransferase involved in cell wall biosynthesis
LFTIIIPTHERPLLLRRALQSLIAQTYKNFQVIVVDDSAAYIPPFHEMVELAGRYTYIIRSGNIGPAESRNMALEMVKTPYVMFLDDDDTFEPGHLQSLVDHIGDDTPEILHCDFNILYENRSENPPTPLSVLSIQTADVTYDSVHVANGIPNCCAVYRRDVVAQPRFPTELHLYEDWDFLLACMQGRTLRHVPISSVNIHKSPNDAPENVRRSTARRDLTLETLLYMYKKYPAPNMETRVARLAILNKGEQRASLDQC